MRDEEASSKGKLSGKKMIEESAISEEEKTKQALNEVAASTKRVAIFW